MADRCGSAARIVAAPEVGQDCRQMVACWSAARAIDVAYILSLCNTANIDNRSRVFASLFTYIQSESDQVLLLFGHLFPLKCLQTSNYNGV